MIADRGLKVAEKLGVSITKTTAVMDIDSANECCPLDFERFYSFDNAHFNHDFFGIWRHMDRSEYPGTLVDCFLPGCANPG